MDKTIESEKMETVKKGMAGRVMGAIGAIAVAMGVSTVTTPTAAAEINSTTFDPIVNLIDAIIPLFTSILDLIIAVFPLVIAMAFLGGLAMLISKIFDGTLDLGKLSRRK
jgi:hypothetical protein